MRFRITIVIFFGMVVGAIQSVWGLEAEEIIRRAEDLLRGHTSKGTYEMILVRPTYERTVKFRFWEKRGQPDRSLIIIDAPPKDKGTVFLKEGINLYMYLPRVRRTLRLPPSMMLNPWMGSDFTNDDLVRASSLQDDYTAELVSDSTYGDTTLYTVRLTPKPDAPVVWSGILYQVKVPGFLPVSALYLDEQGDTVRQILFREVRTLHGRTLPTVMEVIPLNKEGHRTILRLLDVEFDVPIPDRMFSLQAIETLK